MGINAERFFNGELPFLVAGTDILPGQVIMNLGLGETHDEDPRRIQYSATRFILPPQLLYHSCRPNTCIDWDDLLLRAVDPIPAQAMVTYHYGSSELEYDVGAFQCNCDSQECVGYFRGFKYMTANQQRTVVNRFSPSPFIRDFWERMNAG